MPIQPAAAQLIHGGRFLGDPRRVVQRQDIDRQSDAYPPGARGDGGGDRDRRGQDRTVRREVKLGQPGAVEPPCLGGVHQRQPLAKRVGLTGVGPDPEFHENSEMHGTSVSPPPGSDDRPTIALEITLPRARSRPHRGMPKPRASRTMVATRRNAAMGR